MDFRGKDQLLIFRETRLKGAYLIEPDVNKDSRGSFSRIFDLSEFRSKRLNIQWPQWSVSYNGKRGTLRGMHFQIPPHNEIKLIRCNRGAIYDVLIDLRPGSESYKSWQAFELAAEIPIQLYVPKGFAHGFLTLRDNTEVTYHISEPYSPEYSAGVRWDDPAFNIDWPEAVRIISDRDSSFPDFHA